MNAPIFPSRNIQKVHPSRFTAIDFAVQTLLNGPNFFKRVLLKFEPFMTETDGVAEERRDRTVGEVVRLRNIKNKSLRTVHVFFPSSISTRCAKFEKRYFGRCPSISSKAITDSPTTTHNLPRKQFLFKSRSVCTVRDAYIVVLSTCCLALVNVTP